jgi:hypothetical protein
MQIPEEIIDALLAQAMISCPRPRRREYAHPRAGFGDVNSLYLERKFAAQPLNLTPLGHCCLHSPAYGHGALFGHASRKVPHYHICNWTPNSSEEERAVLSPPYVRHRYDNNENSMHLTLTCSLSLKKKKVWDAFSTALNEGSGPTVRHSDSASVTAVPQL